MTDNLWHTSEWYTCPKCNGEGYIDKKECLMCRFDITADENGENGLNNEGLILRGKIRVTDNFIDPISPPSSPR
tara:strand:+ start:294 stop:515 length:222 start_codon:yes stop_codon:yes gene_type:complete